MTAVQQRLMTVDEYVQYELKAECRHEYIDGQLFEMPGEQAINSSITQLLTAYFSPILSKRGYNIYSQTVKVIIPGGRRIYYPDWFVTCEQITEKPRYIQYEPELIVEVLSKSTEAKDRIDKYLDYIKIPSLKYYITIDPERIDVIVYYKIGEGWGAVASEDWEGDAYNERSEIISLPLLETELPLRTIYR